jgi:hypothetical protein
MFYLIVVGFLLAGFFPFYGEYQYRHSAEYLQWANVVKRSYLTLDLALGCLLIATAVGLFLRKAWARTLALAMLMAWLVKTVLVLVVALLFLERLGAYAIIGIVFLGKLAESMGSPTPGAANALGSIFPILANPIGSRLLILLIGVIVVVLLQWAYQYLRHDDAVDYEFGGAPTVFGRQLTLRGRDFTLPLVAAVYLALPFLSVLGRLPVPRSARSDDRQTDDFLKAAREPDNANFIVDLEFDPDVHSMLVFSAKKGAARVDLDSGKVSHLDPAIFTTGEPADGTAERIHTRVSPDHRWFANRENELVSIADGTKRRLQLASPLGRPVVFLTPNQLLAVNDRGEFQWIDLDPDRVAWTASAFPEGSPPTATMFYELSRKAPRIEVSPARNALYYEVADAHYVMGLESGQVWQVAGAGRDTRFEAFSQEGDKLFLRVPNSETRQVVLLEVDVATGATTPLSWAGSPIYVSSASDVAVTKDHTTLMGFALSAPTAPSLWQRHLTAHLVYVSGDGSSLFSALGPISRFSWAPLDPRTGPGAEKEVLLQSVQGRGESPRLVTDSRSQIAAWCMGLRVEVFWIANLGDAARKALPVYDLASAF